MSASAPSPNALRRLDAIHSGGDGNARYHMVIPENRLQDAGLRYLWIHETRYGGYEFATRQFIEQHLQADDVFIDVGAHWGLFSLQAATHKQGGIDVLAVEAHPDNVCWLDRQVMENKCGNDIEVIAAAAGADGGTAPLVLNSSMGHSLYGRGLPGKAAEARSVTVPLVSIDRLIAERKHLQHRPVIMKIDVEGFEPQVLETASDLMDSGAIRAIIFEKGGGYASAEGQQEFKALADDLRQRGFSLWRFAHPDLGGKLLPYAYTRECYNVIALAPTEKPKPVYAKPKPSVLDLSSACKAPTAPEIVRATTRHMDERKTTDAARWVDPDILANGALERAQKVVGYVKPGQTVMDIGSGLSRLHGLLPKECGYARADLAAMGSKTQIVDLNTGDFPQGQFDHLAVLAVLEYLHDVKSFLVKARRSSDSLLMTYHCKRAEDSSRDRRERAMVNDYSYEMMVQMLDETGWQLEYSDGDAGDRLFVCKGKN